MYVKPDLTSVVIILRVFHNHDWLGHLFTSLAIHKRWPWVIKPIIVVKIPCTFCAFEVKVFL